MVDVSSNQLSIQCQCTLLSLHRSGVYYQAKGKESDTLLSNEIHDIWLSMPFYGYRKITATLHRQGLIINEKRVRRLMNEMQIHALYPRSAPKCSPTPKAQIYPYLLRGMDISRPNAVWATDITYLKLPTGFVYLVAIIDWHSRYVLSWRLSNTMDTHFCVEMLQEAYRLGTPEIINTDQGAQFTSHAWLSAVTDSGAQVSMDGVGRWVDNVRIERFWRSFKYEQFFLYAYQNVPALRRDIQRYMTLYNDQRIHQHLGYQTPAEVYYENNMTKLNEKPLARRGYIDNLETKLAT